MKKCSIEITDAEIDDLFKLFSSDSQENQLINYTQFIHATLDTSNLLTKEKLWSIFKQID